MIGVCFAALLVASCDYPTLQAVLEPRQTTRPEMLPVSCPPEEYHTDHFAWLRDYMAITDDSPMNEHLQRMSDLCLRSYSQDTIDDKAERYRLMMIARGMPAQEAELRSIEYKLRVQSK